MMNGMVFGEWLTDERRLCLISSRDYCLRLSPSQISDTPRAGFEPAQNLSSDFDDHYTTAPQFKVSFIIEITLKFAHPSYFSIFCTQSTALYSQEKNNRDIKIKEKILK